MADYDREQERQRNQAQGNRQFARDFRDEQLPAHYREQADRERNRENRDWNLQHENQGYESDPYRDQRNWENRENYNRDFEPNHPRDDRKFGSHMVARISGRDRDWRENRDRDENRQSSQTARGRDRGDENRDWREQHPYWNRDERNRQWIREAQDRASSGESENSRFENRDRQNLDRQERSYTGEDWTRNITRAQPHGSQEYEARDYDENRGTEYQRYDRYRQPDQYSERSDYRPNREETLTERVGWFVGVGPKGYRRSDERIREDVSEKLEDHPAIDASNIEVAVKDGEVTLTGSVDNRSAKRLAEDVTASCRGVKDVHNQIRVTTESLTQRVTGKGGRDQAA